MTDERLENVVGNLLRAGVLTAALIVLTGGVWYLATHGGQPSDFHRFRAQPRTIRAMARMSHADAIMLAGLLLLILTPISRVAFSLVAFALERDRLYVVVTAIVLSVLLYSIGTAWW